MATPVVGNLNMSLFYQRDAISYHLGSRVGADISFRVRETDQRLRAVTNGINNPGLIEEREQRPFSPAGSPPRSVRAY
jgi:hypothetical protein